MIRTIPAELTSFIIDAIEELPTGIPIWKSKQQTFTRAEIISELANSTSVAHEFCADILRISRAAIKQRIEEELRYEVPSYVIPAKQTLEWMKSLKVLLWDGEERVAEDFTPFLEPEDVKTWEKEGGLPSFAELIYLTEMNGDRVIEIRTDADELVYNGRKKFEQEQRDALSLDTFRI